jgi:hypothetical protein
MARDYTAACHQIIIRPRWLAGRELVVVVTVVVFVVVIVVVVVVL